MFFVYILQSEKTEQYYIGHTHDPEKRLKEHNESLMDTYTSKHRPWQLKAKISVGEDRGDAMRVEKYIKGRKSREFIEKIISGQNDRVFIEKLISKIITER